MAVKIIVGALYYSSSSYGDYSEGIIKIDTHDETFDIFTYTILKTGNISSFCANSIYSKRLKLIGSNIDIAKVLYGN